VGRREILYGLQNLWSACIRFLLAPNALPSQLRRNDMIFDMFFIQSLSTLILINFYSVTKHVNLTLFIQP
jgi:hypothetical protein